MRTALGDPAVEDACVLMPRSMFASYGDSFDTYDVHNPAQCSLDILKSGNAVASVYLLIDSPSVVALSAKGGTKTSVSGVTTYTFPDTGSCNRVLVGSDVGARILTYNNVQQSVSVACDIADLVVAATASRIAKREALPPIALPSTGTLTSLDMCAVAARAGLPQAVPIVTGARATSTGFGTACHLRAGSLDLIVGSETAARSTISKDRAITLASHTVYEQTNTTYCSVESVQQPVGNGQNEVLAVSVQADNSAPNLCGPTETAMTAVLKATGLR